MKRFGLLILLFFSCAALFSQDDTTGGLLIFCGGRPFSANTLRSALKTAQCPMTFVTPDKLDGNSGGSTKQLPTDDEPEKIDGITPEFEQLSNYKLVFFTAIPKKNLANILTEERIAQLKEYLANGGNLLLNRNAPDSVAELLPVKFTQEEQKPKKEWVQRPNFPEMSLIPERWKKIDAYRPAVAKKGSTVHAWITTAKGTKIAPAVVSMPYGKGRVYFFNAEWKYVTNEVCSFNHWAYGNAFMTSMISHIMGVKINYEKNIKRVPERLPDKKLASATCDFREYSASLVKGTRNETKQISDGTYRFAGGITLTIQDAEHILLTYPGTQPREMAAPKLVITGKEAHELLGTEAISKGEKLQALKAEWSIEKTEILPDGTLSLVLQSTDLKLRRNFTTSTLMLDGRKYIGLGEQITVEASPAPVESIYLGSRTPGGKIRLLTCYTAPRGYREEVLKPGTTSKNWQFFCSGQPFTYFSNENGIFVDMVDDLVPCFAEFKGAEDGKMDASLRLLAGYRSTMPVKLPILWHFFTPGEENGNNDYIAIYQFVRRFLREKCGIKTFPTLTQASFYVNGRSIKNLKKSAEAAKELNFQSVWLSFCPWPLENVGNQRQQDVMTMIRACGLVPHFWSAGGYSRGDKYKLFRTKPEYFVKTKKGGFHHYFKIINVGDFNNADFRDWYFDKYQSVFTNGPTRIYMDMGGEISRNVNFSQQDAEPNLIGLAKFLKKLSDEGIATSVEGMNPLALDQALLNPYKAFPYYGKEFAYCGGTPLSSVDNGKYAGLYIDYFRLLMFNGTTNIDVDGYRFKFERVPDELKYIQEIGKINEVVNPAKEFVPAPFVRETSFGTMWAGEKTGALFFEHSVGKLDLTLPKGWKIKSGSLQNIPRHSVMLLEKQP